MTMATWHVPRVISATMFRWHAPERPRKRSEHDSCQTTASARRPAPPTSRSCDGSIRVSNPTEGLHPDPEGIGLDHRLTGEMAREAAAVVLEPAVHT